MLRKEIVAALLWIIGTFITLYIIRFPLAITYDSGVYIYGAKSLAKGEGFRTVDSIEGRHLETKWMPGYSWAISVLHKLTRQGILASIRWVNFISCLLFIFLWLFFFTKILRSIRFVLLAGCIFLVWPGHWNFLAVALSEGLFMVILALAGLSICFARQFPEGKFHTFWIAALSLSILAACLIRYAGFAFALGTTIFLSAGLFTPNKERTIFDLGIFLFVMMIGGLPWLIRNKWVAGKFLLMTPIDVQAIHRVSLRSFLNFFDQLGFQAFALPDNMQNVGLIWAIFVLLILGLTLFYLGRFRRGDFYSSPVFWTLIVSLCYAPLLFYTTVAFFSAFHGWVRYYWILTPLLIGLFAALAETLDEMRKEKPSIVMNLLLVFNIVILLVTGFSGLMRSYGEIVGISQRKDTLIKGFVFQPQIFGASKEAVDWLRENLKQDDLLFSNYSKFVPVLWQGDWDCYQIDMNSKNQIEMWKKPAQRIYLLLSKNNFHYQNRPEWTEYLNELKYDVLYEDQDTLLCVLVS